MRKTWVQSLGREDPLEKEMATHSSTLAWKIQWTEECGRLYSPWGRKELDTTEVTQQQQHALELTLKVVSLMAQMAKNLPTMQKIQV